MRREDRGDGRWCRSVHQREAVDAGVRVTHNGGAEGWSSPYVPHLHRGCSEVDEELSGVDTGIGHGALVPDVVPDWLGIISLGISILCGFEILNEIWIIFQMVRAK